jgi:hypothetical protein
MSGGHFTWTNNQQDPTLEKLDRFLMNDAWENLFPLTTVHKLVREISDHNPLILDTMEQKDRPSRDFKFEKSWIQQDDFLDRVNRAWHKPVRATDSKGIIQMKLKNVKNDLKGWGANLRGRDIKRKKEIGCELEALELQEELYPLDADQIRRRAQIQKELLTIIDREESYWHQRSREKWLLQGDSNTAFFHRMSNGCKRKRTIFSLKDGDNIIQGTPDLLEHATAFYKNLFGPANDSGIRLADETWSLEEKIDDLDRESMDRPFSEDEIKNTIDQMENNKAAGPDGIPAEFYKVCWDIIKLDIMAAFNDFHSHKIDLKRINYGIITSIPKGPEADKIQKYRPICLLQILFKIFTKALTKQNCSCNEQDHSLESNCLYQREIYH